jgi:hypothetical protein
VTTRGRTSRLTTQQKAFAIAGVVFVVGSIGATSGTSEDEPAQQPERAVAAPTPTPRFEPAKVAAAKAMLAAEPAVSDVHFDAAPLAVTWQVGVSTLPSRFTRDPRDYARLLCGHLDQAGVVDSRTSLRLVDLWKLESTPGDFQAASLGQVRCATGDSLGT